MLAPWKKNYDKPRQHSKKQRHQFTDKDPYSQSYGFSSSHVWIWELDHKESWALNNWFFWTAVLEKTLESPMDCKEIQPVHPKGNQSWIVIQRTDAEAEAPILGPPDAKSQLTGKDPEAGKDWGQEEKGAAENEMVGWHHRLTAPDVEQTPRDGEGQGSLACCSPWGHTNSDMTRWLNWNEYMIFVFLFQTLLCITGSRFIHFKLTQICSFLWWSNIPLYICTTTYPFTYWWISRLLPCPGYCN